MPGREATSAVEAESTGEILCTESEGSNAPPAAILRGRQSTPLRPDSERLARLERALVQLAGIGGQVEAIVWRDKHGELQITEVYRNG